MHKHYLMRDLLLIHISLVNYCGLGTNKSQLYYLIQDKTLKIYNNIRVHSWGG